MPLKRRCMLGYPIKPPARCPPLIPQGVDRQHSGEAVLRIPQRSGGVPIIAMEHVRIAQSSKCSHRCRERKKPIWVVWPTESVLIHIRVRSIDARHIDKGDSSGSLCDSTSRACRANPPRNCKIHRCLIQQGRSKVIRDHHLNVSTVHSKCPDQTGRCLTKTPDADKWCILGSSKENPHVSIPFLFLSNTTDHPSTSPVSGESTGRGAARPMAEYSMISHSSSDRSSGIVKRTGSK